MSNTTQAQKADPSEQPQQQQKPQVLEEDDEFEDFPVEGTLLVSLGFSSSSLVLPRTHLRDVR